MPYLTREVLDSVCREGQVSREQMQALGLNIHKRSYRELLGRNIDQSKIDAFMKAKPIPKKAIKQNAKPKRQGKRRYDSTGIYAGMSKHEYFKSVLWDSIKTTVLASRPFCDCCNDQSVRVGVRHWSKDVFRGNRIDDFWSLCVMHYNQKCGGARY